METENKLDPQPGETIYYESHWHGLGKVTVERLTNTQILINGISKTKLKRPFVDGCREIGASGYHSSYYYRENLDLKSRYEKQQLVKFVSEFAQSGKIQSLTILQLENIKKIIDQK